jgi:hypothetical protein
MVSLGFGLEGAALPHPDCRDVQTAINAVKKRAACKPPEPNRALLRALRKFTISYLRRHYRPLRQEEDLSVESWLAKTTYPKWRKIELLRKYSEVKDRYDPKYFRVKSFLKDETYPEYKHARAINSRTDEFKCFVGPTFRLIEESVYEDKHFIKHVPVALRPKVIAERLSRPGAKYIATDYTAFESLFTKLLMTHVEFELYRYMTQSLPNHKEFMWYCHNVLAGTNVCDFNGFTARMKATRMSGEMCTSLGNGFANLMVMLFMLERNGCYGVDGFVEGDDGLFVFEGPVPTEKQFEDMGLTIKMIEHGDLCRASFCGIIFDEFDQINVTNPLEVLASLGWTSSRYTRSSSSKLKGLLRCKALSLAHQYPGCPIISTLAFKVLELTRGTQIKRLIFNGAAFNNWEREQLIAAFRDEAKIKQVPIGNNTRLLVSEEFGISLSDQAYIEDKIEKMTEIRMINDEYLLSIMPRIWREYYDAYHVRMDPKGDIETEVKQFALV